MPEVAVTVESESSRRQTTFETLLKSPVLFARGRSERIINGESIGDVIHGAVAAILSFVGERSGIKKGLGLLQGEDQRRQVHRSVR